MLGDSVAIQAGVAGVLHQGPELLFFALFPQFAEVAPMSFWILQSVFTDSAYCLRKVG